MTDTFGGQLCFDCKKSAPTLFEVEQKFYKCNCSTHINIVHVCAKCKERREQSHHEVCHDCQKSVPTLSLYYGNSESPLWLCPKCKKRREKHA